VQDVRQLPADESIADAFVPFLQAPGRFAFVLMRTVGAPETWHGAVRSAVREIDPEIAVGPARSLKRQMDEASARPRFLALLLGSFAAVAALLALVGMYGVVAYAVRQREREIAVRMAIGADPARITRLFLRQGGWILLAGLILGVAGALGAGRLIESQLFGVTPAIRSPSRWPPPRSRPRACSPSGGPRAAQPRRTRRLPSAPSRPVRRLCQARRPRYAGSGSPAPDYSGLRRTQPPCD